MIDAHQHFWAFNKEDYGWLSGPLAPLARDYLPADLQAAHAPLGFKGSVLVQVRQSLEESRWMLGLARQDPRIVAVVGWADLRHPEVGKELEELAKDPKFRGLRHIAQDEPDDRFLVGPDFVRGLEKLAPLKLTYDLLVYARQLPAAIELVKRLPQQAFVLDHLGKPEIKAGRLQPWAAQVRDLAKSSNVWCKVSGMVTEADWGHWTPAGLEPYLDTVFEAFGPQRLMFGSDWPVCLAAAEYRGVYDVVSDYVQAHCPAQRASVFGGNALKFYGAPAPA